MNTQNINTKILSKSSMSQGEKYELVKNLHNIQLKLNEASGLAVGIETRMRLIGELSDPLKAKLKEIYKNNDTKITRKRASSPNYWKCELWMLEEAIIEVFKKELEPNEVKDLENFRDLRNSLLHGNLINLLTLMGIPAEGRMIDPKTRKRNILTDVDIKESIICIENKGGLEKFRPLAFEVMRILEKIICL